MSNQDPRVDDLKKRRREREAAMASDRRVTDLDFRVAWLTLDMLNTNPDHDDFGKAWRSAETISAMAGCDGDSVLRCWRRLRDLDHLYRKQRAGRTDHYMLDEPPTLESGVGVEPPTPGSATPDPTVGTPPTPGSDDPTYDPNKDPKGAGVLAVVAVVARRRNLGTVISDIVVIEDGPEHVVLQAPNPGVRSIVLSNLNGDLQRALGRTVEIVVSGEDDCSAG